MESVALLNDVPLLVPRGRYEIDIGRRALKFHGKSYDYTILYTNINRQGCGECHVPLHNICVAPEGSLWALCTLFTLQLFRVLEGTRRCVYRMFLVPRPSSPHVNFILSLDNAMRQGQTSYPFVVLQFDSDQLSTVDVNLEEAELKERGLEKQIEGTFFTFAVHVKYVTLLQCIIGIHSRVQCFVFCMVWNVATSVCGNLRQNIRRHHSNTKSTHW